MTDDPTRDALIEAALDYEARWLKLPYSAMTGAHWEILDAAKAYRSAHASPATPPVLTEARVREIAHEEDLRLAANLSLSPADERRVREIVDSKKVGRDWFLPIVEDFERRIKKLESPRPPDTVAVSLMAAIMKWKKWAGNGYSKEDKKLCRAIDAAASAPAQREVGG